MESSAIARYIPQKSKKRVFPGSSSACMESEVVEVSPPSDDRASKSKAKTLRQKEVVLHEIIDVDMDEDRNDVVFVEGTGESNKKRKGPVAISLGPSSASQLDSMDRVHSSKKVESNNKGKGLVIMSSPLGGVQLDSVDQDHSLKSFSLGSNNFFDLDDYVVDDDYLTLQSRFDNMDLPTGIEAPIPWLSDKVEMKKMDPLWPSAMIPRSNKTSDVRSGSKNVPSVETQHQNMPSIQTHGQIGGIKMPHSGSFFANSSSNFSQLPMDTTYPLGIDTQTSKWHKSIMKDHLELNVGFPGVVFPEPAPMFSMENTLVDNSPRSSSLVGSSSSMARVDNEDVLKRYESFKKFDTVVDHSDHYYATQSSVKQPPKNWAKKIQDEWRILEKDLPDTIFVRVYESRMDLLRAVIIGAEGTPYHDGLFFFDVCFPSSYPNSPPFVHYHSGGLRINPNLYDCGKVCLSLLNTWTGGQKERWVPGTSTMLQVLVSIQGLILNTKPYFNEPGFANSSGSLHGEQCSLQYNENTLILSLRTMVYTMKKPPKNFEDLVIGHFRNRVRDILMACKAYTEGVQVGCLVKGGVQDVDEGNKSCSTKFKNDVASFIKTLVGAFKKIGAKEAEEFLSLSEKKSVMPASAPTSAHPHAYPSFPFTAAISTYNHYW